MPPERSRPDTLPELRPAPALLGEASSAPASQRPALLALPSLARAAEKAEAKVFEALDALAVLAPAVTGGTANRSILQRAEQRTRAFVKAAEAYDAARVALLGLQLPKGEVTQAKLRHGAPSLRAAEPHPLSPQQEAALQHFLLLFQSADTLALAPNTLAEGARPASARTLLALSEAFRSPHGAVDPTGAANVEHLASVFRGVLETEARRLGRPLAQDEADRLAFNTVLTDAWMKGNSGDDLQTVATAPTNAGSTGAEIQAHLKAQAKARIGAAGPLNPAVERVIHGWIDRAFVPMAPDDARKDGEAAGLDAKGLDELMGAWGQRIMASGDFWNLQGFMLGVWLHGLPAFDAVEGVIGSAGGARDARDVYMAVLGHHMAGFIASGLARGDVRPKFARMEAEGQLPEGGAAKLEALYGAAMQLAAKWRPRIDAAAKRSEGLGAEARAGYRADAAALRSAVEALPEDVRSQLLNDDAMQFTPEAIAKWIGMNAKSKSNAEVVKAVFAAAQAYYEEQLARDPGERPGEAFRERTNAVATRLGVTLDATGTYRLSRPGEAAHRDHAEALAADSTVRSSFAKAQGLPADASPAVVLGRADALVTWFREGPPDPAALTRVARGRPEP